MKKFLAQKYPSKPVTKNIPPNQSQLIMHIETIGEFKIMLKRHLKIMLERHLICVIFSPWYLFILSLDMLEMHLMDMLERHLMDMLERHLVDMLERHFSFIKLSLLRVLRGFFSGYFQCCCTSVYRDQSSTMVISVIFNILCIAKYNEYIIIIFVRERHLRRQGPPLAKGPCSFGNLASSQISGPRCQNPEGP